MKKFIGSILLVIFLSCTKHSTPPLNVPVPEPTNANLVTLDHTDSLLVGNWILDSAWHYNFFLIETLANIQYYSDANNCHLQLTSNAGVNPNVGVSYSDYANWKYGVCGLYCNPQSVSWKIRNGSLNLFGSYVMGLVIKSISSSKLVLYYIEYYPPNGCNPGKSVTFYLHKQ